ncbi:MAG: hypothetical protein ACRCZ2_09125, partial [Fusobacteriaceae bacterium]
RDIDKKDVTHIQKIDPGPPEAMAVATPEMFPLPISEAIMVISDCSGEIVPLSFGFLPNIEKESITLLNDSKNFLVCTNCNFKVKKRPVNRKRKITELLHRILFEFIKKLVIKTSNCTKKETVY